MASQDARSCQLLLASFIAFALQAPQACKLKCAVRPGFCIPAMWWTLELHLTTGFVIRIAQSNTWVLGRCLQRVTEECQLRSPLVVVLRVPGLWT